MGKVFLSRVWVRINGVLQETDPTTTKVDLGGFEREAVVTIRALSAARKSPRKPTLKQRSA